MRRSSSGLLWPLMTVLLAASPDASAGKEAALRNLERVRIAVIPEPPCRDVVDRFSLEQSIQVKLRMAGLTIGGDAHSAQADLSASIACVPITIGNGRLVGMAVTIQFTLDEMVHVDRIPDRPVYAATWIGTGNSATCSGDRCIQGIREVFETVTNEFVNDFLSANPPNTRSQGEK